MNELDMSRPGSELFQETGATQYNSYEDVNMNPSVEDPLNMGVKQSFDAANQAMSDKEMNFRALREQTSKLQAEREYWKGQAEAFKTAQPAQPQREDPTSKWDESDWSEGNNVRKAFETLREENQRLKNEFQDQLAAVKTVAQHSDWNKMVTEHVPELTNKNPIFAEMINRASNPYEAAYLLAELNSRGSQQPQNPMQQAVSADGQRAIQNASKPASMNMLGGNGTLSSADYYASMSDEDFMKIAGKNMANI
jgi:hypothetical protein